MRLARWKPAVRSHWLFLVSGVMWTIAGVMLEILAITWLEDVPAALALPLAVGGLGLAVAVNRMGFKHIAWKNMRRIGEMPRKVCVFSFQRWHSYLVMAFMIALGMALRQSGVPKPVLAPFYVGMGGALLISSWHYYRQFLSRTKPPSGRALDATRHGNDCPRYPSRSV